MQFWLIAIASLVGVNIVTSLLISRIWIEIATVWHAVQLEYAIAAFWLSTTLPVTLRMANVSLNIDEPSRVLTATAEVLPPSAAALAVPNPVVKAMITATRTAAAVRGSSLNALVGVCLRTMLTGWS